MGIHHELNLRQAVEQFAGILESVEAVYLFGSRRYGSGSARSDIDLLVVGDSLPAPSVIANVARGIDSYLDIFIVRGTSAHSAINESVIEAKGEDIFLALDVAPLWDRATGWKDSAETFASVRVLAGFVPPYTLAAAAGPEPGVCRVDVMFVSALPQEYAAVISRFDRIVPTLASQEPLQYAVGEIETVSGVRVVAALVADRAGPVPAALATLRGIEMFRPKLAVLVGITAGIREEVALGDLVVPDTIVEYEATKVYPTEEKSHGRVFPVHPPAIAAIHAWTGKDELLDDISQRRPEGGQSYLRAGAMASGSKVIASQERATLIAEAQRKTMAIEMEAIGLVEACDRAAPLVPALVVKAVSDYADESKDDAWHEFCADAAADLATSLVRARVI